MLPEEGGNRIKNIPRIKIQMADVIVEEPTEELESPRRNIFKRFIDNHFRIPTVPKSEVQIRKEEWLVPIPFNRWHVLPAAIVIQFCCGSLYAWSVFNKPIDVLIYGNVTNTAPITFYIAVGFFGLSAACMGPWLERTGPMIASLLGTTLFFTGNLLTALALYFQQMWLVFLGYGVVAGLGLGLSYISPVSALQKWFPDRRGLASGLAVCGYGAGSIGLAKVQIPLMNTIGLPLTFVVLGSVYFILMFISSLILRTPPPNFAVKGIRPDGSRVSETTSSFMLANSTLMQSITSSNFKELYMTFLANSIFGLVLISRLSNMVTDIFGKSPNEAATVVSINGGFNLGGRLIFSALSDYIGRKNCFLILLTIQLIIVAVFSVITNAGAYWTFLMAMWILTSCYGAGFGIIPAFLADLFGPVNIGACHGIILTAWSIAGVTGGLIFTAVFDFIVSRGYPSKDDFPYNVNSWWIFSVVLVGWVTLIFVEPTRIDQIFVVKFRGYFRKWFCTSRVAIPPSSVNEPAS